ncbi:GDSL-like lipase/acylhydrolase, putative [Roseobacter sp. SK209-2-6]|uniref:SGNH/GDSL hydrolase family protein n=1 Tax=Roseobacter sp. SK209-2-6 TaxID=388739 RepID=UPI0000F3FD80|nr:SGNH/GDSL hydrolase family protein [Roseobacter sp. SK209-2-6]EBA14315.1 GDSL-like lipase/acylhydrolase, putative [Roseobacter sp. SK209-2-6]
MIALDQILRLPLAPLLFWQGRRVRKQALILPEPQGARKGAVGSGPPLRLLIAGDSSAAGVGAGYQRDALSGYLTAELGRHCAVEWQLIAQTGLRTGDLIPLIQELPRQDLDVVVLALGVNDVTGLSTAQRFARDQALLLSLLQERFDPNLILACGVPQMQRFPALPQPLAWVLGRQAARLDQALSKLAGQNPAVLHLPFHLPEDPDLAAEDGYHPSPRAYRLWAEALAAQILHHSDA